MRTIIPFPRSSSRARHSLAVAREEAERQRRKRTYSGFGVRFIRCGGGFRIVRRAWLPGEEREA